MKALKFTAGHMHLKSYENNSMILNLRTKSRDITAAVFTCNSELAADIHF
jgi:hypothetical protein